MKQSIIILSAHGMLGWQVLIILKTVNLKLNVRLETKEIKII